MKTKSALILCAILLATAGLITIAALGIGSNRNGSVFTIRQGLDLMGGVSILYEAEPLTADDDVTGDGMTAATSLLRNRLDSLGYLEASVIIEGTRQIRVDIPGVDDAEAAVRDIGRTAILFFISHDGVIAWENRDPDDERSFGAFMLSEDYVLLTGAQVSRATPAVQTAAHGGMNEIVVQLEFTAEGTTYFANATRNNIGRPIHIFMDDELISSPVVNAAITDGSAVITGNFSREGADELATLIRQGSLPFGLNAISMNRVGARLGVDALSTSVIAGIIGLALVLIFMAFIYKTMGLCADLALIIYVTIVLLIISFFNITLSLPGIAGLILSIGMATDANIVIFERIREEVAQGKTLRSAMRTGYRRALPAIIDSNVTTLIAGGVLFWLGTGPIMGFAQMLMIGIVVSMFTCIVVTRIITVCLMDMGVVKASHILSKKQKQEIEADGVANTVELPVQPIVERRKIYFIISGAIIAIGLAFAIFNGVRGDGIFNQDVEFSGGTSFTVDIGRSFNNADVERIVRDVTGESAPMVQQVIGTNTVMIRTQNVDADVRLALVAEMSRYFNIDADAFTYADVSPAVSAAMRRSAIIAVAVAALAMLAYISIRFRNIKTGAAAVFAQLHDALIVLCIYAILRIPLNYAFIAVILTTLGYSINATIIIFDRIRENRTRMPKSSYKDLINTSVTQTLRRTLFSTISSFIAVLMLYIIGVAAIRDFTLPIMVGLIFGAYSSVCLAGSVWYMMLKGKKEEV